MQILVAGVVYEITAEAVFLFVVGLMTLYALLEAGLAWAISDPCDTPGCEYDALEAEG